MLIFSSLPFIWKRETRRDLRKLSPLSGLQSHPQLVLEGVVAGEGWRDLGKAYRYRYLYRIRLDDCQNEEVSISQWLDRMVLASVIPNVTLGQVSVRQRK